MYSSTSLFSFTKRLAKIKLVFIIAFFCLASCKKQTIKMYLVNDKRDSQTIICFSVFDNNR